MTTTDADAANRILETLESAFVVHCCATGLQIGVN